MTSRLREFQEASTSAAPSSQIGSRGTAQKQEQADALRRKRKRRLARAQALQQQPGSYTPLVDANDPDIDAWTLEATRIASIIASLGIFLSSIRRAYLDLSSSASTSGGNHAYKGKGAGDKNRGNPDLSKGAFEAWKDLKWLNDKERDEVDWQAKTTLKKCMNRVRQLEQAEKSERSCSKYLLAMTNLVYLLVKPVADRHAKATQAISSLSASNISRFLGIPMHQSSLQAQAEEQLHSHRQQVVLYLSRRLADVGHRQQEQQERRVARQMEKQNMSRNTTHMSITQQQGTIKPANKVDASGTVPSMFVPAPISMVSTSGTDYDDDDQAPIDTMLSMEQIQQFESESSALLQEANSQLASIEKAQTSLLEISNLQSELAVHLTQQMEITDKLWEDSVLVSGRVDEGNKQLRQARDRNREGRLWLLIFLVGASFSLLFLEYY
jgi:syntaxin 18